MEKNTHFIARYTTARAWGSARFDTKEEMYMTLEVEGIVEGNPGVEAIDYYEVKTLPSGQVEVVRHWLFDHIEGQEIDLAE